MTITSGDNDELHSKRAMVWLNNDELCKYMNVLYSNLLADLDEWNLGLNLMEYLLLSTQNNNAIDQHKLLVFL